MRQSKRRTWSVLDSLFTSTLHIVVYKYKCIAQHPLPGESMDTLNGGRNNPYLTSSQEPPRENVLGCHFMCHEPSMSRGRTVFGTWQRGASRHIFGGAEPCDMMLISPDFPSSCFERVPSCCSCVFAGYFRNSSPSHHVLLKRWSSTTLSYLT